MSITEQLAKGVWYAPGATKNVAAAVMRQPDLFDELFECLLSEDRGTCKRAAMALNTVSKVRPELFDPYADILLTELENHLWWYVRFWLCPIIERINLSRAESLRAIALFQDLVEHPQSALAVNALGALGKLVARSGSYELREETLWLVEHKMRTGTKAMQARCRMVLPLLRGKQSKDK